MWICSHFFLFDFCRMLNTHVQTHAPSIFHCDVSVQSSLILFSPLLPAVTCLFSFVPLHFCNRPFCCWVSPPLTSTQERNHATSICESLALLLCISLKMPQFYSSSWLNKYSCRAHTSTSYFFHLFSFQGTWMLIRQLGYREKSKRENKCDCAFPASDGRSGDMYPGLIWHLRWSFPGWGERSLVLLGFILNVLLYAIKW